MPPDQRPRSFLASRRIFSSSWSMNGSTFPSMSKEGTPGSPAPERAWYVGTWTRSKSKASTRGLRASTSPVTEQFGFVTMKPPRSKVGCRSTRAMCSAFTSGRSSGTSSSMRWDDAFEKTRIPARAASVSKSRARSAGRPLNAADTPARSRSFTSSDCSSLPPTSGSSAPSSRQKSDRRPPTFRSEAVKTASSNTGWSWSRLMKRWPIAPVAPTTATGNRLMARSLPGPSQEPTEEHEVEDRHRRRILDDRHGPRHDAGIVASGDDHLRRGHRREVDGPLRFRDGGGRLHRNPEDDGHSAGDPAEDPTGVVRRGRDPASVDDERIVMLAPAHRCRAKSCAEVDALHGGNREEQMGQGGFEGLEKRFPDARGQPGHDALDDPADAIPIFARSLDLRDHSVRRIEVGTAHGSLLHLRLDLFRRAGSGHDASNLGGVREETDSLRGKVGPGDRPRDHEGGRHPTGELAPTSEVALPSIFHDRGEVAMTRARDAAHLSIGFRPNVFVPEERDDWLSRRGAVEEASREFDAIGLLPLGDEEALARSPTVELSLDEPLVDRRPRGQPFDRASYEGPVACPEDRRPVPRSERVHATTAWRAPKFWKSSRKEGYETRKDQGSQTSTTHRAARPATAAAIRIRWSPRASTDPPSRRVGPTTMHPSSVGFARPPRPSSMETVASIRSLSLNRRWRPFTNRVSPCACDASTARIGKRSGVSPMSTVWATSGPPLTRTRSPETSTDAPKLRRISIIFRSPSGPSTSRPVTVTSPSVIADPTSGKAADEKSPGTSVSVDRYR